jgi:signal transduction histidine kinase/CheY-like chemotaxis protein
MRFRSQLLLLVLSILIPSFLASAGAVWYVYSNEQKEQERNLLETTRGFAIIVDNELRIKEATLRTLANSPLLEKGDMEGLYSYAKAMAPTPESTIILRHASGRQVLNTRRPLGTEIPARRVSNVDELRNFHGPDDTVVSDLFFAPVGKRFDFVVDVPVKQNKHSYSSLVMGVNASSLQPILRQQRFPSTWMLTIVDRNGVVVARSHDHEQFVGKPVSERTKRILSESRGGTYYSITLNKIPVKAFYRRVPLSDWTVLISIPETELRKLPLQAALILGTSMLLLLAVAVIAASWLAGRLVKPIKELGEAAERMEKNEEVSYTPGGVCEINSVGQRIVDASNKIRHATQELERRVAEASTKAERAERALQQSQKLEALGRLTGGIAHEFNNVLQTISSAVQLAKLVPEPDHVLPLMDTCSKAVDRATALTSQLSAFGRAQDAKLETICVREQLEEFKALVKGLLPSNIKFELHFADESWPVMLDTLQFELAFLNIVINARDAMPHGGALTVQTGNHILQQPMNDLPPGEYVRISISDTGTGMPAEVLSKALEPFYTTKPLGKGTGLGLAQAYGFARQSQGTLILNSVEGQGTTVEFYLPKASASLMQAKPFAKEERMPIHARGIMLFVEDDPLVREATVPVLENAGLTVLVAANADEALAIFDSETQVDTVFSDVMMPGKMSGVELAKAILDRDASTGIILATGYSDFTIDLPNVKVLAKPYRVEDILDLI